MQQNDPLEFMEKTWGDYGREVIVPNLKERFNLRSAMQKDPGARKAAHDLAMRDIIFCFKYFFWTHEPRSRYQKWYGIPDALVPFVLYPKQEELVLKIVDCIDNGREILVDKSREQGATWIATSIILWYWLHNDKSGNDFLVGSRKFDSVDKKGAQDTLFAKFRYQLERLPACFLPADFDFNKHIKVGLLENPESSSAVNGEANNENFATSGRYKAIFADEFAKWEETDDKAYTSMASASLSRIIVSTPFGMGRKFSKLRFDGAIPIFTLGWEDHPLHSAGKYLVEQHPYLPDKKDVWVSPWYLNECSRRKSDPEADIGQELDRDHLTSGMPYFRSQAYYIQEQYKALESQTIGRNHEFERVGDEVQIVERATGRITILEDPVAGWKYRYSISADVAEGLEHGDNSVFYIFDRHTLKDVAWFVGKVDTYPFALLLSYYGYLYNEAYIAVEANNQGNSVLQELKRGYDNLYHRQDFNQIVDLERAQIGFHTNTATKPIACGRLQKALDDKVDGILDKDFFNEAARFMVDGKTAKLGAASGSHDDRVIAQAIKWILHAWLPAPMKVEPERKPFEIPEYSMYKPVTKDIRTIWNEHGL